MSDRIYGPASGYGEWQRKQEHERMLKGLKDAAKSATCTEKDKEFLRVLVEAHKKAEE
jgi:hypothetical protein